MKILTSITFLSLLTSITKDNRAITIIHAKSKLCHSLFLNKILQMNMKSDFIQPVKLVINYRAFFFFFGLYHVFHTQYAVIQQSKMSAGVIQVVYILFHGLSKITSVVPFNVSYKFWLPLSCYDILC